MPLVAHHPLPAFEKLRQRGEKVLSLDDALRQDIRELHVGLLNMMPDAALTATEMQFMRLVGSCNQIAQFFVHPFTIPALPRGAESQAYIDHYYKSFDDIRAMGLDALIVTGANVSNPSLDQEPFWEPLREVMEWADGHVTSVLCSCLATHALVKQLYHIERELRPAGKLWGVYSHHVVHKEHPLLRDINTRFDVPHSRFNAVHRESLEQAGLTILIESEEAGVHMAVSPDQFGIVYFQGHPEYDTNSLLKEYKREVKRFFADERDDYPPYPEHYFNDDAAAIAARFQQAVLTAKQAGKAMPAFPEEHLEPLLDNTWRDTAKGIVNNWLGMVYEHTDFNGPRPQSPSI
ncbi:MAG: homoserine O-succinyltransferase [Zetaproteobacteria bacterium CG12_big_fil_rev_8_21_14_0_65_55_1124]|nr:MAG: homoserine O-succinyltransferase [Zetaproteobacteria bacterium CG1_02_55_237]PIS20041.1 MAG: homoserine O-succinyltransferase [Zetaproteobacteria bacterium CG08_land_8_20_14_0_20_55_17]PIW42074.1 MAG: homoserine O-succinyltransferase [Zetaproteobacteria bacterium CG12_big_fil_rev_8_21_14_0_65_55_1124]PIY52896.1 MAG: homoserine O-succinyltransferase [Zetaproteobacteria bacterium CG_4_10_14_0_8_um_filter_55_43]PIZ39561.1 MAG: homoserine O-succinyltransferase [Zetaproteobacteria bacterium 